MCTGHTVMKGAFQAPCFSGSPLGPPARNQAVGGASASAPVCSPSSGDVREVRWGTGDPNERGSCHKRTAAQATAVVDRPQAGLTFQAPWESGSKPGG